MISCWNLRSVDKDYSIKHKYFSDYRDGRRNKDETLIAIHGELDKGPELSAEEKKAALRLCVTEIDSTEARAQRNLTATEHASRT